MFFSVQWWTKDGSKRQVTHPYNNFISVCLLASGMLCINGLKWSHYSSAFSQISTGSIGKVVAIIMTSIRLFFLLVVSLVVLQLLVDGGGSDNYDIAAGAMDVNNNTAATAIISHRSLLSVKVDKLQEFYTRLARPDVKYCPDKTRLLPGCKECIPGLKQGSGSSTCNEYVDQSKSIRNEIATLTSQRYGAAVLKSNRPFGLYPYLEGPDFLIRQEIFGKMLSERNSKNILDVGAYYNPIHLFFSSSHCPASVTVIEPILNALSAMIPCTSDSSNVNRRTTPGDVIGSTPSTHFIVLPITFKYYITVKHLVPKPDSVVCIGCDSHYGPNRQLLETTFDRPYTLFLEYPSEYVHNAPFKKMMATGTGESMLFLKKFQPKTNETQYTKRVMKVIDYSSTPSTIIPPLYPTLY